MNGSDGQWAIEIPAIQNNHSSHKMSGSSQIDCDPSRRIYREAMTFASRSMTLPAAATRIFLGAFIVCVCCSNTRAQAKTKYLAIFTTNVNVDGTSYKKGYQAEALALDRTSQKVAINDRGKTVKVPAAAVKVLPEDKVGITIVDATFTPANESPRNVAAKLQRKYDGQQTVSFVVAGKDFGVRSVQSQMTVPQSGTGGTAPPVSNGGMGLGGPGGLQMMAQMGTLEVTFYYKGSAGTVSAPEGQKITIPAMPAMPPMP